MLRVGRDSGACIELDLRRDSFVFYGGEFLGCAAVLVSRCVLVLESVSLVERYTLVSLTLNIRFLEGRSGGHNGNIHILLNPAFPLFTM